MLMYVVMIVEEYLIITDLYLCMLSFNKVSDIFFYSTISPLLSLHFFVDG